MATYNLTERQKKIIKRLAEEVVARPECYFSLFNGKLWDESIDPSQLLTVEQVCSVPDLTQYEKLGLITTSVGHGRKDIMFTFTQKGIDVAMSDFRDVEDIFTQSPALRVPLAITESLSRFRKDYPDPRKCCFVMMKFGVSKTHKDITKAIRSRLKRYGITALRADDKEYADSLYENVLTYLHGCGFGIAIFERLLSEDFNPNVSLEVGYMLALGKPVCLMKDATMRSLHTDLVGKVYRTFDTQHVETSLPDVLKAWLDDKDLLL